MWPQGRGAETRESCNGNRSRPTPTRAVHAVTPSSPGGSAFRSCRQTSNTVLSRALSRCASRFSTTVLRSRQVYVGVGREHGWSDVHDAGLGGQWWADEHDVAIDVVSMPSVGSEDGDWNEHRQSRRVGVAAEQHEGSKLEVPRAEGRGLKLATGRRLAD